VTKRSDYLKKKKTPGGVVTTRAFDYSCSFYDFAGEKLPELRRYPQEKARGTALQAAIIVATLILMERRSGGAGREELHDGVSRSFAASVSHRNLSAIRDLASALLETDLGGLKADAIPSLASLAGASDEKLVSSIGVWLILAISRKPQLEESDLRIASAIGRSAWTSATMIVRALSKTPSNL
jgi:hypothetical protein